MHSLLSLVSCQRTDMGLQQNSIGDISGNLVAPWSRAFWRHHVVCGEGVESNKLQCDEIKAEKH